MKDLLKEDYSTQDIQERLSNFIRANNELFNVISKNENIDPETKKKYIRLERDFLLVVRQIKLQLG